MKETVRSESRNKQKQRSQHKISNAKLLKYLARLIKKKRNMAQINKIRNKKGEVISDIKEV